MTSIITGDIINSRKSKATKAWLNTLKSELNEYGKTPRNWEIFRGDSFQLEIKKPEAAVMGVLKIKARIAAIKNLNVRMSVGIGEKTYNASKITEANGDAFVRSGEAFEKLKASRQTIMITSPWTDFDYTMNTMLSLACITIDTWSVTSASFIATMLKYPNLPQKDIGKKMRITQSSVSERRKRSRYDEIMDMEAFYRYMLTQTMKIP
jgi:hypothetical protein